MTAANLIRLRNAILASRIETTPGVDVIGGTPNAADFNPGTAEITFNPNIVENPTLTGALDRSGPIVGGFRPNLTIRMPLRGSGSVAVPDFAPLLRAAGLEEVTTAAAVGTTPQPITAGTSTSITLSTPASLLANVYRGMPLNLTTPGFLSFITAYEASTRVATLAETLTVVPDEDTEWQILPNILYRSVSDESILRTVTLYAYADGLRWRFTGGVADLTIEAETGGLFFLVFRIAAQYLDGPTAAAIPAGAFAARPQPPRFVGGKARFLRGAARFRSFTIGTNNSLILPDDPEASEGVGPGLVTDRLVGGTADPYQHVTDSPARMTAFRAGTRGPLVVGAGSVAGNRFAITVPEIYYTALDARGRDNLGVDAVGFTANGADNTFFLCFY